MSILMRINDSPFGGQDGKFVTSRQIRDRLARFVGDKYDVAAETVRFDANHVRVGKRKLKFADVVGQAYLARVSLSATGYFRTPNIHYDRENARGRPFRYFAYGAAVSEVIVDTLTGENKLIRADILHDAGKSINPAIDIGQVEGGFVQGMGWLTMEEVCWDDAGRLTPPAPSTYKIPVSSDAPPDLRVTLLESGRNREDVVHRSKAVGEPPLMLAISVFLALKDAIASVGGNQISPRLDAPATPERVLLAVEDLRTRLSRGEGAMAAAE